VPHAMPCPQAGEGKLMLSLRRFGGNSTGAMVMA
jgi:hypothetical protein